MKVLTLKRLEISDFRARNVVVDFKDNTIISGENGVGKSTVMKAWNWLLSGYTDSYSPMNTALFDDKRELTPETPTARVKATIEIDGMEYTLERTATAKFSRKRGTNEYQKDASDQYCFYIDNIETKSNDFKAWIDSNICPNDMITFLLDGSFLTSMIEDDKNKSRKVLEKIVGEIREDDFKGDYSILKDDMVKFSIEQIEERTKREIAPIKDRMQKIPAIIENYNNTLTSLESKDFDAILREIEKKKSEIEDIDNRILGNGEAIKPILGERNHLLDIINQKSVELYSERSKYENAKKDKEKELERKINEIIISNETKKSNFAVKTKEISNKKSKKANEEETLKATYELYENAQDELREIKGRIFTDDRCAYCGQELPEDMLAEAKEKFNARKKAELNACIERGKRLSEDISNLEANINRLDEEIKEMESCLENPVLVDTKPYKDALSALREKNKEEKFEDTEIYSRMNGEIEALKAKMPELPENDNDALTEAKKVLMGTLDELNREYGVKSKIDEIKDTIKNLRKEEAILAMDLARLEGKLAKCAEYKQEKADIISYRINGKLKECTIDMWSRQKDGTLVPDVVLKGKNGVRFSSLNFSDRIRTCIDIQRMFMEHFEIVVPVWVDESSCFSSNNLPVSEDGQMVYLYASESPVIEVSYNID